MSGPLAVALTADISKYETAMTRARDLAVRHAGDISKNFVGAAANINTAFKGIEGLSKLPGQLNTAKTAALGLAGTGAFIIAAYAAVSSAIGQANDQLDRFVKLGENAEKAGVGVEFFQRFTEAAKEAKLSVAEIEAALKRAGSAVTPKFEGEDAIRKRLNELFESGFTGAYQSRGLAAYNAAGDNETRIRAAVEAMRELRDLGLELASIDLAEKLFGSETADRIRSGRLDIEAIATALDRRRDDLVRQEEVDRAAEFKDALAEAYKQIDDALHVSVGLANAGQSVLDVWLKIVQAVADASVKAGGFLDKMIAAAKLPMQVPQGADVQSPLGYRTRTEGQGSLGADLGAVAGTGARGRTLYPEPIGPQQPTMTITDPPAPPRRPLDWYTDPTSYGRGAAKAAKPAASASETRDQLETYINGLTRSTAALKAEVDAIGKSNAEKLTGINLAKAEEIAKQNGLTLSAEQIAKIRETSAATAQYREKLEEVREAQEALRSIGGDVLKGIYNDARNGASAIELMTNAVGRLADRLADRTLDSLADMLFGSRNGTSGGLLGGLLGGSGGAGGGLGSILGFLTGSVSPIPKFATGGHVSGPGGPTDDRVPALLSSGEFVVNARATARHRDVLQAINSGRVSRFATGGMVGAEALGRGDASTGGGATPSVVTIAPTIHLSSQGGDPAQNADLAAKVGKQVEGSIRGLVAQELRAQMRPMGLLNRV